jgi:hypothetical protein
MSFFN